LVELEQRLAIFDSRARIGRGYDSQRAAIGFDFELDLVRLQGLEDGIGLELEVEAALFDG
jgi:hypothetical protein